MFANLLKELPVCHFTRSTSKMQPQWILPGLRAGQVGVVAAPGGTGKSFFLMQLALSVATGYELITGIAPKYAGPVRLFNFEDDYIDITNRGIDILNEFGIDDDLSETLFLHPLAGYRLDIVTREGSVDQEAVEWLMTQADGMRLLIIDPLSHITSSDENDNALRTLLVQTLKHIAREKECAILIAHHTNKGDADSAQGWLRGASALVDTSRYVLTMQKYKDSWRLRLQWVKLNGVAPIADMALRRECNGVLRRDMDSELEADWGNGKTSKKRGQLK
jgi:RecA-family ATPase